MTCEDFEEALHPYVDGELLQPELEEVEQHLSGCDECRALVDSQRAYRRLMRQANDALSRPAPVSLRDSIRAGIAAEPPPNAAYALTARTFVYPAAAIAVAATCAVLYVESRAPRASRTAPFVASSVASHQRALPLEVQDAQLQHIQTWLQGKVDFSPSRIPTLPNARLVGARVSNVSDRQAALVAFDEPSQQKRMTLLVFDAPDLVLEGGRRVNDHDVVIANQKGYNVALWKDREIVYSLVSDLREEDILRMLEASPHP